MRRGLPSLPDQDKIVHYHEEPVYIHVVSYLESGVRVVNADAFEQCRVSFDVFSRPMFRDRLSLGMSAVQVHEVGQIVMAEIIQVRISRPEEVCVLYHGKYQTFRESAQHSVIVRYCLGAAGIRESLEFDSRQFISGNASLA